MAMKAMAATKTMKDAKAMKAAKCSNAMKAAKCSKAMKAAECSKAMNALKATKCSNAAECSKDAKEISKEEYQRVKAEILAMKPMKPMTEAAPPKAMKPMKKWKLLPSKEWFEYAGSLDADGVARDADGFEYAGSLDEVVPEWEAIPLDAFLEERTREVQVHPY